MAARRKLSWNAVLRDLHADRSVRQEVREELLKTPAGPGALGLAAWRGLSARRYVGSRYAVDGDIPPLRDGAVVLALTRGTGGHPTLIGARRLEPGMDFEAMRARIQKTGADEIFIHTLAATEAERSAIVRDLYAPRT